jgi:hypothetical protein
VYQSAIKIIEICRDKQVCVEFVNDGAVSGQHNGGQATGAVPETAAPADAAIQEVR